LLRHETGDESQAHDQRDDGRGDPSRPGDEVHDDRQDRLQTGQQTRQQHQADAPGAAQDALPVGDELGLFHGSTSVICDLWL